MHLINLSYHFSCISLNENGGKKHSIQIIANELNGFNNLCFHKLFNFLSFFASVVHSYGLIQPTTGPFGFIVNI